MEKIIKEPVALTMIGGGIRAQERFFANLTPENAIPSFVFLQENLLNEAPDMALACAELMIGMIEGGEQFNILQGAEAMLVESDLIDEIIAKEGEQLINRLDDSIEMMEQIARELAEKGSLEHLVIAVVRDDGGDPFAPQDEEDLEDIVTSYLCDLEANKQFFNACFKAIMLHRDDPLVRQYIADLVIVGIRAVGFTDETSFVDFVEGIKDLIEDYHEKDPDLCDSLRLIANIADDDLFESSTFDVKEQDEIVAELGVEILLEAEGDNLKAFTRKDSENDEAAFHLAVEPVPTPDPPKGSVVDIAVGKFEDSDVDGDSQAERIELP